MFPFSALDMFPDKLKSTIPAAVQNFPETVCSVSIYDFLI